MLKNLDVGEQTIFIRRIEVVPDGHNTGKWQLIINLWYSPNRSVNDCIFPDDCSLEYTTVDKVATIALRLRKGTLLVRLISNQPIL